MGRLRALFGSRHAADTQAARNVSRVVGQRIMPVDVGVVAGGACADAAVTPAHVAHDRHSVVSAAVIGAIVSHIRGSIVRLGDARWPEVMV